MDQSKVLMFKDNLKALKKRYTGYYDKIVNAKIPKKLKMKASKTKIRNLVDMDLGIDFYGDNPVQTCAENITLQRIKKCQLAVFFGMVSL